MRDKVKAPLSGLFFFMVVEEGFGIRFANSALALPLSRRSGFNSPQGC